MTMELNCWAMPLTWPVNCLAMFRNEITTDSFKTEPKVPFSRPFKEALGALRMMKAAPAIAMIT